MRRLALCLLLLWPLWIVAQEDDDTTFQIARVRTLQEVLIKAEEPAWIREKLKLFIQKREENYQQEPCFRAYDFFFQDTGSDLLRGSTSRKVQFPDLIDIYPPRSIEIYPSKSRRYQMQERLRKVPRQYVMLKE